MEETVFNPERVAMLRKVANQFEAGPQDDSDFVVISSVEIQAVIAAVWRYVAHHDGSTIVTGTITLGALACAVEDCSILWNNECHFIAGEYQMATIVTALREQADAMSLPFEVRAATATAEAVS